jgi:hypothetical protein
VQPVLADVAHDETSGLKLAAAVAAGFTCFMLGVYLAALGLPVAAGLDPSPPRPLPRVVDVVVPPPLPTLPGDEIGPSWPRYAADRGLLVRVQDTGADTIEFRVVNRGWGGGDTVSVDISAGVLNDPSRDTLLHVVGLMVPKAGWSTVQLMRVDVPPWLRRARRHEIEIEIEVEPRD